MNKLRDALASASSSAASVMRAPQGIDDPGRSSTATSWSNARRRTTQSLRESLGGKADVSDDGEYTARKGRVLQYEKLLKETRAGAGAWLEAARVMAAEGGSGLGQSLRRGYGTRPAAAPGMTSPPIDHGSVETNTAAAKAEAAAEQVGRS